MQIINHKLVGEGIKHIPSPHHSSLVDVRYIIIHYTAGRGLDQTVKTFQSWHKTVSAHLVIGKDGRVVQMVPFDRAAWHAGRSRWGELTGMNKYSIGIELDNYGRLDQVEDGYQTWFGVRVDPGSVVQIVHQFGGPMCGWESYPDEQIDKLVHICAMLYYDYHVIEILGHDDIAPGRKLDPGPAFPMKRFKTSVWSAFKKRVLTQDVKSIRGASKITSEY